MKRTLLRFLIGSAASAVLVTTGLAVPSDYPTTVQSHSPVVYWRLNETIPPVAAAATNSGSGGAVANGTYHGGAGAVGVQGGLAGVADTAAYFDGVSQYIQVPQTSVLNPSGAFTVEFWAKLNSVANGAKTGVESRSAVNTGYLFFACNGNQNWQFRVYTGTGNKTVTDNTVLQANTWYHVTGVYDGTTAHVYVNGVENVNHILVLF